MRSQMGIVMNNLKPYIKYILVYLVFSIIMTALQLLNPIFISAFFDNATLNSVQYLLNIVLLILLFTVISNVLNVLCSMLDIKVRNKIILKAKSNYLVKLLKMDYDWLETIDYGDKKTRYDLNDVYGELAISFIANSIIQIFTCLFICTYLFTLNWKMTCIFIACLFFNSILEYRIGKKTYKHIKDVTVIEAQHETTVTNVLKNIPYIKTSNSAKSILLKIESLQHNLADMTEAHTKDVEIINSVNIQIYKIIEVIIFAVAAFMLNNNEITIGAIYLFINYMGWIDNAFSTIWDNYIKYKSAKAKIHVINSTFRDKQTFSYQDTQFDKTIRKFSLLDISFHYKNNNFQIQDINMELIAGDFVAVIGESGCGKTTLMKILCGLYHPDSGAIFYNGCAITDTSPENRADVMAYIPQNAFLADDTIRNFIDYQHTNSTDAKIYECLEAVQLMSLINELPDGLDTYISDSKINLSGGQMQRLLIARSLIYEKNIYIFDEITSGLDEDTQNKLLETLKNIAKNKIMIFVTHRVNSLKYFNKVFAFDNGTLKKYEPTKNGSGCTFEGNI